MKRCWLSHIFCVYIPQLFRHTRVYFASVHFLDNNWFYFLSLCPFNLFGWTWEKTSQSLIYVLHICLFDCFELYEQFFSYLAAVTITDDRTANLDLCLDLQLLAEKVLLRASPNATRDLRFAMFLANEQSLPIITSFVSRGRHEWSSNSRPPGCYTRALSQGNHNW
jgi:hypothetical protein